eukprot:12711574-Heterocapsa_arctica.AAC.1
MSAEHLAKARLLYDILVQVCSGQTLSLLRLNAESNGLECWRQLHFEFEPTTATRTTAVLSSILMPAWSVNKAFLEQLMEWEHACDVYAEASGHQLPEDVKCAIVARWAPGSARRA